MVRGYRDRADDSLLTLLGDLPDLVSNLVKAEIDAAKTWIARTSKDAGIGSVWFLVALFFLFWSIPALGAFTIIGLSSWMPAWLASLIVFVLGIVLVAIFAVLGLLRFKRLSRSENPAKAIKVDARIVKEVADEF